MAYYSTQKFETNAVYDHLEQRSFRYIIGLDIGHGTTRAILCCKADDMISIKVPLKLDAHGSTRIPTAFVFREDGTVDTGYDAAPVHINRQFMTPPDRWDKASPDGVHTFRELMSAYIGRVWRDLLRYNPEQGLSDASPDDILLVASFPDTSAWATRTEEYRRLIEEAAQHPHAAVISNARAALMHAVHASHAELANGAVLFDIGAVTTDFVYVRPGERMITRSTAWGGNRIDLGMLEKILAANGLGKHHVPMQQLAYILSQVRTLKEKYYAGGPISGEKLHFLKTDAAGRLLPPEKEKPDLAHGDLPGVSARGLTISIDDAFMDDVLAPLLPELEAFFRQMKNAVVSLSCGAVILTGGAGQLRALQQLAAKVFGPEMTIIADSGAAFSTADGLAHIKHSEITARDAISAGRREFAQHLTESFYLFNESWRYEARRIFCASAAGAFDQILFGGPLPSIHHIIRMIRSQADAAALPQDSAPRQILDSIPVHCTDFLALWWGRLNQAGLHPLDQSCAAAVTESMQQALSAAQQKINRSAIMAEIISKLDFKRLFCYIILDPDMIRDHTPLLERWKISGSSFLKSMYNPLFSQTLEECRALDAFAAFPELLNENLFKDGVLTDREELINDLKTARFYAAFDQANPALAPEALAAVKSKFPIETFFITPDCFTLYTDKDYRHIINVLSTIKDIRNHFDRLYQNLYEELLGKMLLLVFDEKPDLQ